MAGNGKELEVKFYLRDHAGLRSRLEAEGARVVQARVHETNLRFDLPGGELVHEHKVLRLRMDSEARATYKGPGEVQEGVQNRVELEFAVSDFDMARRLFEALGYQVVVMYEKFRTTYAFRNVLVTLDEMPFGAFAEIEGPDGESIRAAAEALGLAWEKRIFESYLALFDKVRAQMGFEFRDLSFENFEGRVPEWERLGVEAAW